MAVRIVARDPSPEPQDVRRAELVAQDRFDLRPSESGVPALDGGIEQTLLGREKGAATVHVDAAALEHHVARAGTRAEQAALEPCGNALGNAVVLLPIGILGPRIEAEPRDRDLRPRLGTP